MRYADGTEVRFENSSGPDFGAIFIGEKGKVEINRNKYASNPVDLIPPATLEENDVPDHFRNWLECIKTRATPNAAGGSRASSCFGSPSDQRLSPGWATIAMGLPSGTVRRR